MSIPVPAGRPFGLMHQMWQLPDDSAARFFAQTVEDVAYADQLGFDSVWLAEHHYARPLRGYFSAHDVLADDGREIPGALRTGWSEVGFGLRPAATAIRTPAAEKLAPTQSAALKPSANREGEV
jgi:alkanesulfonate monooxygenase SsuD/methylene tetrahydromethanopterin reductase-like flavin-dependent oxidoreductase (luciferase family)